MLFKHRSEIFSWMPDVSKHWQLVINKKFKERFEHNEKLKDMMRYPLQFKAVWLELNVMIDIMIRLKELEEDGLDESSSSEEEDEEGELITPQLDMQILETLQRQVRN